MKRIAYFIILSLILSFSGFAQQKQTQQTQSKKKAVSSKKKLITVNLQDVELGNVVRFISDVTGKNFIFDESLKGKVTIIAPTKISADEAFSLFTAVLNMKGFTMIPAAGKLLKIVPANQAKTMPSEFWSDKLNETYITKLIPLDYVSPESAMKFLQPLISKDGHISIFGTGNFLLIVDSAMNLKKIEYILSFIDKPYLKDDPEMYVLQHAIAEDMAKLLNDSLGRKEKGIISGEDVKILSDPRLNAVIIIGSNYAKESIKRLIGILDVPQKEYKGNVNVYFLENADATDLAKVLDNVIKTMDEAKSKTAAVDTKSRVSITPDKATNSLVINAPATLYTNILSIIKNLDKRRRQVYVEAMIVEASIDRLRELGSKWRAVLKRKNEPVAVVGFGEMNTESMLNIVNGLSGISAGGMGNFFTVPITQGTNTYNLTIPGFSALFAMEDFKDAVNVLSSPQILTADNKEAEIIVGENVPFISKKEADPSRTTSVFNTIERKDVGITLKLTPQITEGEYVKLDLYQEISALKQQNAVIVLEMGPTTTKRSTRTSVVVKDRQTVVISGLMQERTEEIVTKVPFLGDIPLLGFFFSYKSFQRQKTNLMVFLTPHIVRDAAELSSLTDIKKLEFADSMADKNINELIMKVKPGIDKRTLEKALDDNKLTVKKKIDDQTYLIEMSPDKGFQEVKDNLTKKGIIEYIEPNIKIKKP